MHSRSTRARATIPTLWNDLGQSLSRWRISASAAASSGSISHPPSPWVTASGIPPFRVPTTGVASLSLEEGQPEPLHLLMWGFAGAQCEQVGGAIQVGQILLRDVAEPPHERFDTEFSGPLAQGILVGSAAGDEIDEPRPDRGREKRQGLEDDVVALVGVESGDGAEHESIRLQAEPCPGGNPIPRRESVVIDGQGDCHSPAIRGGRPDQAKGVLAIGDDQVGRRQHKPLQMAPDRRRHRDRVGINSEPCARITLGRTPAIIARSPSGYQTPQMIGGVAPQPRRSRHKASHSPGAAARHADHRDLGNLAPCAGCRNLGQGPDILASADEPRRDLGAQAGDSAVFRWVVK